MESGTDTLRKLLKEKDFRLSLGLVVGSRRLFEAQRARVFKKINEDRIGLAKRIFDEYRER